MTELTRVVPDHAIRMVYNGTGGTLSQGTFVKLKAAPTYKGEIEAADGNDDPVYGVLMADVLNGARGDCQIFGIAKVLASTTVAVGVRVMPTTGAKSVTATAGHAVIGIALTAGATDTLHEVELSGPAGARMPG
jgi:Uncharacterized conserved protein (DUF2190)